MANAMDIGDPYATCPGSCAHTLARGVLVAGELLDRDGPEGHAIEQLLQPQAQLMDRFPMLYRRPD